MNEEINPVESPSGDTDTPPPPAMRDGWHAAADGLTATLYRDSQPVIIAQDMASIAYRLDVTENRAEAVQARNNELLNEQISGDDFRLTDFWEKAQELADSANHCEVFDTIAEALGGPSRVKEWSVTVTMMVQVPVSYQMDTEAKSAEEAEEWATDYVRSMNATDLEDSADWWSAEVDTYSMEAEAEEA